MLLHLLAELVAVFRAQPLEGLAQRFGELLLIAPRARLVEVAQGSLPLFAQALAHRVGEVAQRLRALGPLCHELLLLFQRVGHVVRPALARRLLRLLEGLLCLLAVFGFELVGELLHLLVERGEIAIAERIGGVSQLLVLVELAERGLEALARVAAPELLPFGRDVFPELRDLLLGLALLHALLELLAELLGALPELLQARVLGLAPLERLEHVDHLVERSGVVEGDHLGARRWSGSRWRRGQLRDAQPHDGPRGDRREGVPGAEHARPHPLRRRNLEGSCRLLDDERAGRGGALGRLEIDRGGDGLVGPKPMIEVERHVGVAPARPA